MKSPTLAVVLGISWVCSLADAASISLHVELGNHEYFLPPQPAWSFSAWDHSLLNSNDDLIPLTVICLNTSNPDASLIKSTLDKYREVDDVWTPHFMDSKPTMSYFLTDSLTMRSSLYPICFHGRDRHPGTCGILSGPFRQQCFHERWKNHCQRNNCPRSLLRQSVYGKGSPGLQAIPRYKSVIPSGKQSNPCTCCILRLTFLISRPIKTLMEFTTIFVSPLNQLLA